MGCCSLRCIATPYMMKNTTLFRVVFFAVEFWSTYAFGDLTVTFSLWCWLLYAFPAAQQVIAKGRGRDQKEKQQHISCQHHGTISKCRSMEQIVLHKELWHVEQTIQPYDKRYENKNIADTLQENLFCFLTHKKAPPFRYIIMSFCRPNYITD